ncbi:MAG: glutaminase, partial [Pseudomonadota bacterium]
MSNRDAQDYQLILKEIEKEVQTEFGKGKVADYIPALARTPPHKFGMAVCDIDGREWVCGDANELFSIQSISKVFSLLLALDRLGSDLWKRVGREPSGTA